MHRFTIPSPNGLQREFPNPVASSARPTGILYTAITLKASKNGRLIMIKLPGLSPVINRNCLRVEGNASMICYLLRLLSVLFHFSSKNAGFKVITNSDPFEDDDFARAAAALDDE